MTDARSARPRSARSCARQVAKLAGKYGREWFTEKARAGEKTTELWLEIGKNGYLGINIPEEYGGGGGGIGDIAAVCEELAAQGCPLLLMVVSPAICGTIITRYGTEEQKQRWLPGICDGTGTMAFAITEPDAGTNTHNITTTARRDGDEWVLNGRKIYISGVDEADNVLVVARAEDAKTGKLKPVPLRRADRRRRASSASAIPMEIVSPELQFQVFIDDVRLPADALVGDEDGGLVQLFAGLNPERIMAASFSTGLARFALDKATAYAKERVVFKDAIGSHQAVAHPLAQVAHRDRDGPADDPEGRRPLRRRRRHGRGRGRQHGEVRRRRGRLRRRRPRRADPRRQRDHPGVRHGRPAGRHPRRPDRPGQPRDDPQLRRHALAGAAEVVLSVPMGSCRRRSVTVGSDDRRRERRWRRQLDQRRSRRARDVRPGGADVVRAADVGAAAGRARRAAGVARGGGVRRAVRRSTPAASTSRSADRFTQATGDHAAAVVDMVWISDVSPRIRAALDALFGPPTSGPAAAATRWRTRRSRSTGFTQSVALLDSLDAAAVDRRRSGGAGADRRDGRTPTAIPGSTVEAVHELLTPAQAVEVVLDAASSSTEKIAAALR